MARGDKEEEMDPQQLKRLQKIKERDLEKLTLDQMNRCHHVSFKIGPASFYFNPVTTIASAAIIWIFVGLCVAYPADANLFMKDVKDWVTDKWTWLYVVTQDVWAIFIVVLYFSKYSNLRLGRDDEKPEFNDGTYFMMLFSAGIAIGLFYYGVAEPIFHYRPGEFGNRYAGRYSDNQMAQDAINLTYFHWGIHGWIVYCIIGLLLGFLCYRKGLPMTMRTCFYPILGDLIYGIIGDLIDILCIICTMFGVCTSLGLGVMQLNNGISRINPDIEESTDSQIIIVWCVTALATISVVSGLKVGIRRLSEVCFGIGCLIMFFVLFSHNTWYIFNVFVQSIGYYMQWLLQLGFHTDAFAQMANAPDGKENPNWIDGWTIFYWGWWISWSPFVGMFIAKISRGRTIKDFIIYTLTLPSLYSFFWMAIFGGVGIQMQNTAEKLGMNCSMYNATLLNDTVRFKSRWQELYAEYGTTMLSCRGITEMWFDVMESTPDLGMMMSVLSLIAIILYFVTSSDSGSLVIDCLSANGNPEPPIAQRIFWALTEGATATALLKAGGRESLDALQTVSIACGLPFTFCLNWTCVALWRAVREEYGEIDEQDGRWYRSMWMPNSMEKIAALCIDVVAPWWRLSKLRMDLNKQDGKITQIFYMIQFGFPFYLWIILMLVELGVEQISYIGWACLMAFFAFSGGVRGDIREKYDIEGNMIEDFFTMMLVYPLAISQMVDQLENGEAAKREQKQNGIEMGAHNGAPSH